MIKQNARPPMVMIVDDVPKNIQVVGNILRENVDCEFAFAMDGQQALSKIAKLRPDLILLDIMMPEMDGFEVCSRLKADKELANIPIIFLTAKAESDDVVKGFRAGAVDYVTKPFKSEELLARVQARLDIFRQESVIRRQNREQRELLHVLCHDLANPVGSALSLLEFGERDPNLLQSMMGEMRAALSNSLELIELVRKMRAFEEGKTKWELEPVSARQAIEQALVIVGAKLSAKEITPNVDVDDNVWILAEKTSLINSVLNNALTNAAKFSSRGATITISATATNDQVILSIRDYGVGMPESLRRDLFDLEKPTSRRGTEGEMGTGFGMPLLKKFVEAYGGAVEVESREAETSPDDHGTEIKLFFQRHRVTSKKTG